MEPVLSSGHKVPCPRTILAMLHPLKILAHLVRRPRVIAGQCGDAVPVTFVRVHGNHGIMSRAAAKRAGPRIPNPLSLFVSLGIVVLTIVVRRNAGHNSSIEVLVFGRQRVKCRDGIIASSCLAACLKKQHGISCLRQVSRDGSPSGPRSHDDVIELRVRSRSCSHTMAGFGSVEGVRSEQPPSDSVIPVAAASFKNVRREIGFIENPSSMGHNLESLEKFDQGISCLHRSSPAPALLSVNDPSRNSGLG